MTEKLSQFTAQTPLLTDYIAGANVGSPNQKYLLSDLQGVLGRKILTGNTTFYVTATGSDAGGNGSISKPWLTLQHAMNVISSTLDVAGFTVTISIGAGTFAGFGLKTVLGGGILQITGAGTGLTTIADGPNDGVYNFGEAISAYVSVTETVVWCVDVTLTSSINGSIGLNTPVIFNLGDAVTTLGNVAFISGNASTAIVVANAGSAFSDNTTTVTISGNALNYLLVNASAAYIFGTTTIVGNPLFSNGLFQAAFCASIEIFHSASISGTQTGPAFIVFQSSIISNRAVSGDLPGTAGLWDVTSGYLNPVGAVTNTYTVAKLPVTASDLIGARAMVTDSTVSLAAGLGNIVAGVGGNITPVYSDGINWRIG